MPRASEWEEEELIIIQESQAAMDRSAWHAAGAYHDLRRRRFKNLVAIKPTTNGYLGLVRLGAVMAPR